MSKTPTQKLNPKIKYNIINFKIMQTSARRRRTVGTAAYTARTVRVIRSAIILACRSRSSLARTPIGWAAATDGRPRNDAG